MCQVQGGTLRDAGRHTVTKSWGLTGQPKRSLESPDSWSWQHPAAAAQRAQRDKSLWQLWLCLL